MAVSVIYVVFSFSHIDYFIAAYNLAQVEKTGEVADYQYISCLSTDAAPVIARYVEEHPEVKTEDERIWRLNWYYNYLEQNRHAMDDINLRNFNVSHYLAREIVKDEQ